VAATWAKEAVDGLEDGDLGLPAGFPVALPDQLGLVVLKKVSTALSTQLALTLIDALEPILSQDFLVVLRTISTASTAVEDAAA